VLLAALRTNRRGVEECGVGAAVPEELSLGQLPDHTTWRRARRPNKPRKSRKIRLPAPFPYLKIFRNYRELTGNDLKHLITLI
jgi:hypothetical protein